MNTSPKLPPSPQTVFGEIAAALLERDVLDGLDVELIRFLSRQANASDDLPLLMVLAGLCATVKEGGLRIPWGEENLSASLQEILSEAGLSQLQKSGQSTALWAREFHRCLLQGDYHALIGEAGDFKPLIQQGEYLYYQRHLSAETRVLGKLRSMLAREEDGLNAKEAGAVLRTVLEEKPLRRNGSPDGKALVFNPEQKTALAMALGKSFLVISGGPGTGKTSIVANLLRSLVLLWDIKPERIRLAAPTGKAAHRLGQALQQNLAGLGESCSAVEKRLSALEGETLHRLLQYNPKSHSFRYCHDNPLPADLVVVDEVSMVDIFLFASLLDALGPHSRLVLLGDKDQLPSVDAGAVLTDLIPHPLSMSVSPARKNWIKACLNGVDMDDPNSGTPEKQAMPTLFPEIQYMDHVVILHRSHRSEAGILAAAEHINAGEPTLALAAMNTLNLDPAAPELCRWPKPGDEEGGCRLLAPPSGEFARHRDALLESWAKFQYLRTSPSFRDTLLSASTQEQAPDAVFDRLFSWLDRSRILCFTRRGYLGSEAVNRRMGEIMAKALGEHTPNPYFAGAPILILENDYGRELFNGDIGLVIRSGDGYLGLFRKKLGYQLFPVQSLPRYELAFALTVHKSQGSEMDQVLVILPEKDNRLVIKETLYTALTRAKHFAGIYGNRQLLEVGIKRKVRRNSGIGDFWRKSE